MPRYIFLERTMTWAHTRAMQVTQAAAKIIQIRPPSVYKGKGIRIEGTTPRIKAGKRK